MNICFLNSGFPPSKGGVATYSYEWALHTSLNQKISKVKVIAFGNPEPRIEKINDVLEVHAFHSRNFFFIGIFTLKYFITGFNFDVFHATNLFPVGFWTVFWSKMFRKTSIITFHGTDACSNKASHKVLMLKRWTIENATKAIAVSKFTKRQASKTLKIKRNDIYVVYAGVPEKSLYAHSLPDTEQEKIMDIRRAFDLRENTFPVITVCQLAKRKGLEYAIRAIPLANDKDIKLFIVGAGPEKEKLQFLISQLKCKNQIFLTDKVKDLIPYYSIAKIAVLASYFIEEDSDFEGLGLVLLEAQHFGLPVIGTKSGGIPEAVEEGISGFLVPEKDPHAIAEKILLLKNDKELYQNMSRAAKTFAYQKFNPRKNIEEYLRVISN